MVSIPVEFLGYRGITSFQVHKFRWDINRPRTSEGNSIRRDREIHLELLPHETDDMSEPGSPSKALRCERSLSGWKFQKNKLTSVPMTSPVGKTQLRRDPSREIHLMEAANPSKNCFLSGFTTPVGKGPCRETSSVADNFQLGILPSENRFTSGRSLKTESLTGDVCDGEVGFVFRAPGRLLFRGSGRRFRSVHRADLYPSVLRIAPGD